MLTRRTFVRHGLVASAGMLIASQVGFSRFAGAAESDGWRMPDRRRASFGNLDGVWRQCRYLGAASTVSFKSTALIAKSIAAFEPLNMLVREEDYDLASRLCGSTVNLLVQPIDDLWIRDTGPVFVHNSRGELGGAGFNFNGWGDKQEHTQDAEVAEFVCEHAKAEFIRSSLILEGGGIEVDGEGTAIITESCVLNARRNPGVSKAGVNAS